MEDTGRLGMEYMIHPPMGEGKLTEVSSVKHGGRQGRTRPVSWESGKNQTAGTFLEGYQSRKPVPEKREKRK